MIPIPDNSDPRVKRYAEFYAQRLSGRPEAEIARGLGFEAPRDLYRRLREDGFPVCEECGETPAPATHCGGITGTTGSGGIGGTSGGSETSGYTSGFAGLLRLLEKEVRPPEEVREVLYSGAGSETLSMPLLTLMWLGELMFGAALLWLNPNSQFPARQGYAHGEGMRPRIYPVVLENGQRLYLELDAYRSEGGYKRPTVLDEPLRTHVAILAALTVLEAQEMGPIDVEGLRRALKQVEAPLKESGFEYIVEEADSDLRAPQRKAQCEASSEEEEDEGAESQEDQEDQEEELEELERRAKQSHQFLRDLQPTSFTFILKVLRYVRPDFDNLPHERQLGLIAGYAERQNAFLAAVKDMVAYAEYGAPERDLRRAIERAERDVGAAVLREVEGLSHREIGERLGFGSPSPSDLRKGGHQAVGDAIRRAKREILERALGEEGWQREVAAMKAEAERQRGLSQKEAGAQHVAEATGITLEEATSWAALPKEEQRIEELEAALIQTPKVVREHIRRVLAEKRGPEEDR